MTRRLLLLLPTTSSFSPPPPPPLSSPPPPPAQILPNPLPSLPDPLPPSFSHPSNPTSIREESRMMPLSAAPPTRVTSAPFSAATPATSLFSNSLASAFASVLNPHRGPRASSSPPSAAGIVREPPYYVDLSDSSSLATDCHPREVRTDGGSSGRMFSWGSLLESRTRTRRRRKKKRNIHGVPRLRKINELESRRRHA